MGLQMILVSYPEPHRSRARALLKQHPSIKSLMRPNPWTAVIALGAVTVHLGFGVAISLLPMPASLLIAAAAAWLCGAHLSHALYAILHECAHYLVFRNKPLNHVVAVIANLPFLVPVAIAYCHYHRAHHHHQGEVGLDPDLPHPIEFALDKRGRLGRWIAHVLVPLLQTLRTVGHPLAPRPNRWLVLNFLLQIALVAIIAWTCGLSTLMYLGLSLYFTMALHPIAGRLLQEHHVTHAPQETYSYYGPMNRIALNIGYHNEHHDFPFVPWNLLPRLHAYVAHAYAPLNARRSLTQVLLMHLFGDPCRTGQRIVRPQRNREPR